MKFCLFDDVYDTRFTAKGIENLMNSRIQAWLGKQVSVSVNLMGSRNEIMEITYYRKYGEWYENPKYSIDCNQFINGYDEQAFLGKDYTTGTYADFSQHEGRYIINDCLQSIFLPEMKKMAKKHHASRIRAISIDNNLDHVTLKIELVVRKVKIS